VRVSLVHLVGSERELDLKGFSKHTGHNYSDDIYKVETIEPRKVSRNEFVISEAFVWVQGKSGPGHYEQGSGQLLPTIFYAINLLVIHKPQVSSLCHNYSYSFRPCSCNFSSPACLPLVSLVTGPTLFNFLSFI